MDNGLDSVTIREFLRLGDRISNYEKKKQRKKMLAAGFGVVALLAVVALTTFSLTRNVFSSSALEHTCNLVAESGKTVTVTLEDGTRVCLNSGSTLLYPESFSKHNRVIYLNGQGNFDVAKDPDRPFIVKTSYMDIEALGTSFCVQSFPGERVKTTLKEGRVRVDIPMADGKSYFLDPNMQLSFSPAENSVDLAKVNAARIMDWENGALSFVNSSFGEIASSLERRFNVSINYNTEGSKQKSLNVRFKPDESLEDALDVLTLLIPGSRYSQDESRIYYHFK